MKLSVHRWMRMPQGGFLFFFHLSFFSSFFLFLKRTFPLQLLWWQNDFFVFPLPAMREVLAAICLLGDSGSIRKKNAHRSVKLLKAKHWNPSVSVMSTCRTSWMIFFFLFFFSAGTCEWTLTLHVLDTCPWRFLRISAYIRGDKWWQRVWAAASLLAALRDGRARERKFSETLSGRNIEATLKLVTIISWESPWRKHRLVSDPE